MTPGPMTPGRGQRCQNRCIPPCFALYLRCGGYGWIWNSLSVLSGGTREIAVGGDSVSGGQFSVRVHGGTRRSRSQGAPESL